MEHLEDWVQWAQTTTPDRFQGIRDATFVPGSPYPCLLAPPLPPLLVDCGETRVRLGYPHVDVKPLSYGLWPVEAFVSGVRWFADLAIQAPPNPIDLGPWTAQLLRLHQIRATIFRAWIEVCAQAAGLPERALLVRVWPNSWDVLPHGQSGAGVTLPYFRLFSSLAPSIVVGGVGGMVSVDFSAMPMIAVAGAPSAHARMLAQHKVLKLEPVLHTALAQWAYAP